MQYIVKLSTELVLVLQVWGWGFTNMDSWHQYPMVLRLGRVLILNLRTYVEWTATMWNNLCMVTSLNFKNILKPFLYHYLNISWTTSPCLKLPTSKKNFYLVPMEITCAMHYLEKYTSKNSQFAQHIMHKMKPMNFYTMITELLLQHLYSSSYSLLNLFNHFEPYTFFYYRNDTPQYVSLKSVEASSQLNLDSLGLLYPTD